MKKLVLLLVLPCLFFACKKESTSAPKQNNNITGKSDLVFFIDTFRVYSSDLEGNNYKKLFEHSEDTKNSYIGDYSYTQSGKIAYSFYTRANRHFSLRISTTNHNNPTVLKELQDNQSYTFVAGFGNKILYTTSDFSKTPTTYEVRTVNEDGSNDTKLSIPMPKYAARNGSVAISVTEDYSGTIPKNNFYVSRFENGTWSERNSFNLPAVNGIIKGAAISDDGNTFVYVVASDYNTWAYDIYTADITAKDKAVKKVAVYDIPKTGDGAMKWQQDLSISFANGTSNVVFGYGVQVDNENYATKNDYYFVQKIDIAKGEIIKKWKIFGEYGGGLLVN